MLYVPSVILSNDWVVNFSEILVFTINVYGFPHAKEYAFVTCTFQYLETTRHRLKSHKTEIELKYVQAYLSI